MKNPHASLILEALGMAKLPLSIYLLKQDRVSAFEKDLHVNAQTALPLAPPWTATYFLFLSTRPFPNGSVFSTLCCKIRPPFLLQERLLPPLCSFATAQRPSF